MGGHTRLQQAAGSSDFVTRQSGVTNLERALKRDFDSHVSLVASGPASPEALLAGVGLGALSALLMVFAFGYAPSDVLRGLGPGVLFIGVWISSSWMLTRDTGRVLVVMRRGFILGALQWAVLALQWSDAPMAQATGQATSSAAVAVWPTMMMHDVSSVLVWVCAVGFLSCWLCTRSPYRELGTNRL